MKRRNKIGMLVGSLTVCLFLLFLPVSAADGVAMPEEIEELWAAMPEEIEEQLPQGIWGETVEEVDAALRTLLSAKGVMTLVRDSFTGGMREAVSLFAVLCVLLMLSAVFSLMRQSVSSEGLGKAVSFCATCGIFAAVVEMEYRQIAAVSAYFERFSSLLGGMIPVMGAVYAMGGNLSTAAMGSATLYAFLGAVQQVVAKSVVPVSGAFTVFALCQGLAPGISLRGFSGALRKVYTFFISLIATVLLAVLAGQSTLGAAADGTAARAAKLVASTWIPTVGGSVGDTLRTVAASVGYIKSVVGLCGIVFLVLLVLPTLCSLLLTRLVFLLSSGVAEALGCEGECRLLGELGNVWGCLIGAVAISAVTFLLAMTLFIRVSVAVA